MPLQRLFGLCGVAGPVQRRVQWGHVRHIYPRLQRPRPDVRGVGGLHFRCGVESWDLQVRLRGFFRGADAGPAVRVESGPGLLHHHDNQQQLVEHFDGE